MPSYGQSVTLQFVAWDTGANSGKTLDSANFTLKWVKDGTSGSPANSAAEVDSTNAPGLYKIVMTSTEAQCQVGTLCGKSSTSGVAILPITVTFENLPTASPAASGGLLTVGTGSGQINPSSGGVDVQTVKTQSVTCSAGVTIGAYVGNASAALQVDGSGYAKVSSGTGTGQLSITSGVVSANASQFGGQTVTAAAGVTVGAYVGNASAALQVDGSGYAKVSAGTGTGQINLSSGAVPVTGTVTLAAATHTGATIPTVTTVTNAVSVSDKTGFSLAASGLDAISVSDPAGVATTFPKMIVQLWRRFFKGTAKSASSGQIYTYADDGTTVRTTQSYTDDGSGNETLGAAS